MKVERTCSATYPEKYEVRDDRGEMLYELIPLAAYPSEERRSIKAGAVCVLYVHDERDHSLNREFHRGHTFLSRYGDAIFSSTYGDEGFTIAAHYGWLMDLVQEEAGLDLLPSLLLTEGA